MRGLKPGLGLLVFLVASACGDDDSPGAGASGGSDAGSDAAGAGGGIGGGVGATGGVGANGGSGAAGGGAAGDAGTAGSSGSSGAAGTAGTAGSAGTTGTGGSLGTGGSAGGAGATGSGGMAASSGAGGGGGTAGAAGAVASGGQSGAAGSGGVDAGAGTGGIAGSDGGGSGDGGALAAACASHAQAVCGLYGRCLAAIAPLFPSGTSCETALADECVFASGLPGSSYGLAQIDACANLVNTSSCEAIIYGGGLQSCRPSGQRDAGARCVASSQCQSADCDNFSNGCGSCKPGAGQSCTNTTCADDFVCQSGVCVQTGWLGAPCGPTQPCRPFLTCSGGSCTKGAGIGASCSGFTDCDIFAGAWCANGTCVAITFAKAGESCAPFAGVMCEAGLECYNSGASAACIVQPKKGEACGGPADCAEPYECINGVCGFGNPATCN
jgi:hypothetical protein